MTISRRNFFSKLLDTVANRAADTLREAQFAGGDMNSSAPVFSGQSIAQSPAPAGTGDSTSAGTGDSAFESPRASLRGINVNELPEHLR